MAYPREGTFSVITARKEWLMAPKNQRWWLTEDSVELDIEADAQMLYELVSDLPRIGEWSPECESVEWEGDVSVPMVGTTFVGHNAVGPGRRIRYSRHGTVLAADPAVSSPLSPTRVDGRRLRGATGSRQLATAAHGSPSPTRCAGSPHGRAYSTSPSTATRSYSRACVPPSNASERRPRVPNTTHERRATSTSRHSHDEALCSDYPQVPELPHRPGAWGHPYECWRALLRAL